MTVVGTRKYVIRPDVIRKEAVFEPGFRPNDMRAKWRRYIGTGTAANQTADGIEAAIGRALAELIQQAQAELDALLAVAEGGAD